MKPLLLRLALTLPITWSVAAQAADPVTLTIAYQDAGFPALIDTSGVLDQAPFKVRWVLLTGPAANLSALYSKAIDVGHMGDTSLTIEQANARTPWTRDNAPLKIVAGWRNDYSRRYPPLVTAVRTSAKIAGAADLKGHSWAYNYGGYNHAQYLASLVKADLDTRAVQPLKFNDGASSAAAFASGQADVYSGGLGPILGSIDSGDARLLWTDRDTGIPALGVWTARADVLADPAKDAALGQFFGRIANYWEWHRTHRAEAIAVLERTLKLTPERAALEYQLRSGAFRPFDAALLAEEQHVADALYQGKAIPRTVDVAIGFDARYNAVQRAQPPRQREE